MEGGWGELLLTSGEKEVRELPFIFPDVGWGEVLETFEEGGREGAPWYLLCGREGLRWREFGR